MNVTGPVFISEMMSSELMPSSYQNSAEINPAFLDSWPLKMRPIGGPETSLRNLPLLAAQ